LEIIKLQDIYQIKEKNVFKFKKLII